MARDFSTKNVIVGAGQILIGQPGTVLTTLPTLLNKAKTAQTPDNIDSTVTNNKWFPLGYTTEGSTLAIEPTYGEVAVDQLLDVAKIFKSGMRATLATSLTEATIENLLVVLGGLDGDFAVGTASSNYSVLPGDLFTNEIGTTTADNTALLAAFTANPSGLGGLAGGGTAIPASAFAGLLLSGGQNIATTDIAAIANINGGALGYQPVERSICLIGPGPTPSAATKSSDRFYIGYRAVSMEAVNVSVKRDEATTFPVTFRLLPYDGQGGADGNATYGRVVDRIY